MKKTKKINKMNDLRKFIISEFLSHNKTSACFHMIRTIHRVENIAITVKNKLELFDWTII